MITLKLEDTFLGEIDKIVEKDGFQSRTEFIRSALREKVDQTKLKDTLLELSSLKGAAKKKVTAEEYEKNRLKAFEEISKRIK